MDQDDEYQLLTRAEIICGIGMMAGLIMMAVGVVGYVTKRDKAIKSKPAIIRTVHKANTHELGTAD